MENFEKSPYTEQASLVKHVLFIFPVLAEDMLVYSNTFQQASLQTVDVWQEYCQYMNTYLSHNMTKPTKTVRPAKTQISPV